MEFFKYHRLYYKSQNGSDIRKIALRCNFDGSDISPDYQKHCNYILPLNENKINNFFEFGVETCHMLRNPETSLSDYNSSEILYNLEDISDCSDNY